MTVVALSVAFPEGGAQPFSVASFATAVGVSLGVAVAVRRDRGLRLAPLLYVAAVVASFAIASPMGANMTRLGTAFAGPLVLVAAGRWSRSRGTIVVAVVLAAAALWQWVDPAVQAARAWRDPSATAVYYRPLLAELRRADPGGARIEVPFTRDHWESVFLARRYPLARGWERQLDRRLNPLFYAPRLDAAAYGRWLRSEAVRYVALPDVPMDVAGIREAEIVASGPAFLEPVWRDAHWRLFRVRDPLPLATGAARRVRLGVTDVRLVARRPGADRAARALDAVLAAERGQWLRRTGRRVDAADRAAGGAVRARGAVLARRPARAVRRLPPRARGRVQPRWCAPHPLLVDPSASAARHSRAPRRPWRRPRSVMWQGHISLTASWPRTTIRARLPPRTHGRIH